MSTAHPSAHSSGRMTVLAALCLVALVSTACAETSSHDEPLVASDPPVPRNACEAAFLSELTADIGIAEQAPPSPDPAAVIRVMDVCTASELLAADDYLMYASGPNYGRLLHRRLFNGPGRRAELARSCRSADHAATRACQTVNEPGA